MSRCVVNVATGERYKRGQERLYRAMHQLDPKVDLMFWSHLPPGWQTHEERQYGFKAHSLRSASKTHDVLLWCDASVVPVRPLDPLWEKIELDGYWIARNGFKNSEWTCDSAYPDLFPGIPYEQAREENSNIPHVVATAFGLNLRSEIGKKFLDEYYRLAQTHAFCGPWKNENGNCGPSDVHGHRHDQTAASVIAYRLGMILTDCPEFFSYEPDNEKTVLWAEGC